MSRFIRGLQYSSILVVASLCSSFAVAAANAAPAAQSVPPTSYPVAGTNPSQRLAGAPVITEYHKGSDWYGRALYGLSRPYPPSFKFLEDQGPWHTPFNRPGATGPYDIRNWHQD